MFMWTVGYTVGDMMYIAQTTADQRRANWFSKGLWVLLLLCFLAYTGYQVYLSYQSYTNPDWSAGVRFSDHLAFPTVLICPMTKKKNLLMESLHCSEFNETDTTRNCSTSVVMPVSGRFAGHQCALFNGNTSDIVSATVEEHTFMAISFTASLFHIGRSTPFAVILYSPLARTTDSADDSPSFLVVPDTAYWAVLTQEEDVYLDGPSAISFYSSTSSSVTDVTPNGVVVTFSYSSFAVNTYSQVVTYDWLSLVGVLGGAAAFACAVHEIVMIIFTKSLACCCPSLAKKFEDEEEEEEEEEEEKPKKAKSSGKSIEKGAARKGKGIDEDDDEEEEAARSLQSVDLMHHGFNRNLAEAMHDDYGRTPTERLSLLLHADHNHLRRDEDDDPKGGRIN